MRWASLLLVLGCAASKPRVVAVDELTELEPPPATFRWSLTPISCELGQRSTVDTCQGRDAQTDEHLVAVYAPISDTDTKVAVLRYEGEHLGGPLRWQRHVDLGSAPHSAVLTIVRDAVIVAAISNGSARVVAIDAVTGRLLGRAAVVDSGALAVQLEGIHDFARIHVRTADGGAVSVMHPRTARVIASRTVEERSIIETTSSETPVRETELDGVTLAWEQRRLVARRGTAWMRYLRAVSHLDDQPLHRTSLQRVGERMFITLHDTAASKIEVVALDHASGDEVWRSPVTSTRHHTVTQTQLRTSIVDDHLVIHGSGALESFVCSIDLAAGVERACVDKVAARTASDTVFDFPDDVIVTP